MNPIETVAVDDVRDVFGWGEAIDFPDKWRTLALPAWEMAADDFILRYVFRNLRPRRHLEFGTWLGDGVLRCVEECGATVWTINALHGEMREDGEWAYSSRVSETPSIPEHWVETHSTDDGVWVRTDAYGLVGRKYLDGGWGKRVCQIFADSREWDTSQYPRGFFDSAFVDGGHAYDVVSSDTDNAIQLVKPGGLIVWHDFCPLPEVTSACGSTRDVVRFISSNCARLAPAFDRLFWVQPSWLLFGIRAAAGEERPGIGSPS